jgi:DNA-binding transcriptional regulator GbsR (MarR family)
MKSSDWQKGPVSPEMEGKPVLVYAPEVRGKYIAIDAFQSWWSNAAKCWWMRIVEPIDVNHEMDNAERSNLLRTIAEIQEKLAKALDERDDARKQLAEMLPLLKAERDVIREDFDAERKENDLLRKKIATINKIVCGE